MTNAEKYVQAGAAFLDDAEPNWRSKINVDLLDISDGNQCVLGQLYSEYRDGMDALDISSEQSEAYGFIHSMGASFIALTGAWKATLEEKYPAGTIVRLAGTQSLRQVQGSVVSVHGTKLYILSTVSETGDFTSISANLIRTADQMESEYEKVEPIVYKAGDVLKDVEGRFYLIDRGLRTWCLNEGTWSRSWGAHHNRELTLQESGAYDKKRYSELF